MQVSALQSQNKAKQKSGEIWIKHYAFLQLHVGLCVYVHVREIWDVVNCGRPIVAASSKEMAAVMYTGLTEDPVRICN